MGTVARECIQLYLFRGYCKTISEMQFFVGPSCLRASLSLHSCAAMTIAFCNWICMSLLYLVLRDDGFAFRFTWLKCKIYSMFTFWFRSSFIFFRVQGIKWHRHGRKTGTNCQRKTSLILLKRCERRLASVDSMKN